MWPAEAAGSWRIAHGGDRRCNKEKKNIRNSPTSIQSILFQKEDEDERNSADDWLSIRASPKIICVSYQRACTVVR